MSTLKLFAAAILASVIATPALAQGAVISEPGYCAQFYPTANCQNKGPGNPYIDPNWRRDEAREDGRSEELDIGSAPLASCMSCMETTA